MLLVGDGGGSRCSTLHSAIHSNEVWWRGGFHSVSDSELSGATHALSGDPNTSHPYSIPFASRISGYRPLGGFNGLGFESLGRKHICSGIHEVCLLVLECSPQLARFFACGHPNGCREAHYLLSRAFGEITNPRRRILLGSSTRSSGEFETKVRVSFLTSAHDPLPDIGISKTIT